MVAKLSKQSAELTSTQVERFYRTQILSGAIAAGTKLPSNQELAKEWASSTLAVQRALATLAAEGLIERRQRRGTFVRDTAQQTFVGILVGPDLIPGASGFYRLLCSRLQAALESAYLKTRIYDNLTFVGKGGSVYSHGNLEADRRSYPFKGYLLLGTSNVSERVLGAELSPRSVFQDVTRGNDVMMNYRRFVEDSVNALADRGYKRFTYFRTVYRLPVDQLKLPVEGLMESAGLRRLPKPKVWSVRVTGGVLVEREIDVGINAAFGNARGVALKRKLPEVFIVQDDISARTLMINLLSRGIRIPEDVRLCVQTMDDHTIHYGLPIFRYEFSLGELVVRLVEVLKERMRGEEPLGLPWIINGTFREEGEQVEN